MSEEDLAQAQAAVYNFENEGIAALHRLLSRYLRLSGSIVPLTSLSMAAREYWAVDDWLLLQSRDWIVPHRWN